MKSLARRPRDLGDIEGLIDVHPDPDLDRVRYWLLGRPRLMHDIDAVILDEIGPEILSSSPRDGADAHHAPMTRLHSRADDHARCCCGHADDPGATQSMRRSRSFVSVAFRAAHCTRVCSLYVSGCDSPAEGWQAGCFAGGALLVVVEPQSAGQVSAVSPHVFTHRPSPHLPQKAAIGAGSGAAEARSFVDWQSAGQVRSFSHDGAQ